MPFLSEHIEFLPSSSSSLSPGRLSMKRRLAVIVAAEVVGYRRIMEFDEAGTRSGPLRLAREPVFSGWILR